AVTGSSERSLWNLRRERTAICVWTNSATLLCCSAESAAIAFLERHGDGTATSGGRSFRNVHHRRVMDTRSLMTLPETHLFSSADRMRMFSAIPGCGMAAIGHRYPALS